MPVLQEVGGDPGLHTGGPLTMLWTKCGSSKAGYPGPMSKGVI